jgi:glycosyltransferase involved in cell wall biosynthesis
MLTSYSKRIPFFSVIMCTFNRNHLISRALDSLLLQVEKDWECIIVDDGSIDETFHTVKKYADKYSNVKYIYHSNKGTGLSRNAGILAASGMFITFLDSDDEYHPDHLSIRKTILEEYTNLDLLHGGVDIIGNPYVTDKDDYTKQIHLSECVIGGTFVIPRYKLHQIGGFSNLRYADDADLYQKAVDASWNIAKVDYPTYIYHRDSPDSLCSNQLI